jgi:hypothetical protein
MPSVNVEVVAVIRVTSSGGCILLALKMDVVCAYVMNMRRMEEERERFPPRARLSALVMRCETSQTSRRRMAMQRAIVMKIAQNCSTQSVQERPTSA